MQAILENIVKFNKINWKHNSSDEDIDSIEADDATKINSYNLLFETKFIKEI